MHIYFVLINLIIYNVSRKLVHCDEMPTAFPNEYNLYLGSFVTSYALSLLEWILLTYLTPPSPLFYALAQATIANQHDIVQNYTEMIK